MELPAAKLNPESIGELLFSWRDYTPIPLILLLLFISRPTPLSVTCGLLLILAGELVRIYSVAFIGSHSRTRSTRASADLVTSGPFAIVRNPLYVGNFFIVLGVAAFGGVLWFIVLSAAAFALQYYFIVSFEEQSLRAQFGQDYDSYAERVPRWVPKTPPTMAQLELPGDLPAALKSEKRTLMAIGATLLLLLIF